MTYCTPTPIPYNLPVVEYSKYTSHVFIIEQCLKFFGISMKMLKNKSREREILWPRQMVIHILRMNTSLTVIQMAKIFGLNHSTISTSSMAVDGRLMINKEFKSQYDSLIKYLGV